MPIHFTADKKTLVSLIQPTMTAVSSRNTLPALEGLLFTLQGNELSVCGYDLEKGVKTVTQVQGLSDGAVILNAQKVFAIVRNFPDCDITFRSDDKYFVTITGGMSERRYGLYDDAGAAEGNHPVHQFRRRADRRAPHPHRPALSGVGQRADRRRAGQLPAGAAQREERRLEQRRAVFARRPRPHAG